MMANRLLLILLVDFIIGFVIVACIATAVTVGYFVLTELDRRVRGPKSVPAPSTPRPRRAVVLDTLLVLIGSICLVLAVGHYCTRCSTDNSLAHRIEYDKVMWRAAGASLPLYTRIYMSSSLLSGRGRERTWQMMGATLEAVQEELGPGEILGGGQRLRYPMGSCRLHGRPWGHQDAYLEITFDEGKCVRAKVGVGMETIVDKNLKP